MADEYSDVANKEQLAIVIRYVNEDDEICEDFVEFVECENGIIGLALAEKSKSALQDKYGLDMINLRGQCYDGAGNMSGVKKWAGSTCHTRISKGSLHVVLIS